MLALVVSSPVAAVLPPCSVAVVKGALAGSRPDSVSVCGGMYGMCEPGVDGWINHECV